MLAYLMQLATISIERRRIAVRDRFGFLHSRGRIAR
jgi:hypothetical protein